MEFLVFLPKYKKPPLGKGGKGGNALNCFMNALVFRVNQQISTFEPEKDVTEIFYMLDNNQ